MPLARLQRTWHTLRYLRARQMFFYVWRRGIGPRPAPQASAETKTRALNIDFGFAHNEEPASSQHSFTFLNQTRRFVAGAMQWAPQDVNRLWRYNLHYFDFLLDTERPLADKFALLDSWIAANPPGTEPAWEPYAASLRIVNWCKFFWSLPREQVSEIWLASLHRQMSWLERNLEFHILANHLLTNIKAMLFAGVFFEGNAAVRWLRRGERLLAEQLQEQMLPDGGHYERSPQYHCILLEDYLDLLQLAVRGAPLSNNSAAALRSTAAAAMTFLQKIRTPDNDIPLFNDSASGIAARPDDIVERARQLGVPVAVVDRDAARLIDLPHSGLFGYSAGADYLLMDCGDIGPAWQPGHTHCDFLSFVLMVRGQWLIVDSGVCEYEPGELRRYVRSTAAHNVIEIDGADQSEVWGEFRVARRAQRLLANLARVAGNDILIDGAFRGFLALGGIEHQRRLRLKKNTAGNIAALTIEDSLRGSGNRHCVSRLHLHPSLRATIDDSGFVIHLSDKPFAHVTTTGFDHTKVTKGRYCPHFGVALENDVLEMHGRVDLPYTFAYALTVMEP